MHGIVLPLVEHVFGIQPDAPNKTVVFEPHLPTGWEDMSIEDLPVGANLVSFARARTDNGVEYRIEGKERGWRFVLKTEQEPGTRYYLNGKPVIADSSGMHMSGGKHYVLVIPSGGRDRPMRRP
jgi:hypothetical protein